MNDSTTHPIWNPETGITDLEADPEELSASEIPGIKAIWTAQRQQLKGTVQLSEFIDKLSREWAIETGIIENLYEIERGVTQMLIEQGFQAELLTHGSTNKPRAYVIQLLRDQKDALDGVFDFVKNNRNLSTSYIKELHAALLRNQETTEGVDTLGRHVDIKLIKGAWKIQRNFPERDGITYAYCPPERVGDQMDQLVSMYADHVGQRVPSEVRAAWLHHRFTQIHPFQDGNGRVARALASLVLVKDGLFPLVVTRDEKRRYIDALEAADDGNLKPLIDLIVKLQITRFRKATAISETLLVEGDVKAALGRLSQAADKIAADKLALLRGVFDLAGVIEDDLHERLTALAPEVVRVLRKVSVGAVANANRSSEKTDHYYRAQIIENARHHIGYFADTAEYRSWVALHMRWSRHSRLVFAIHGIGKPFNGSLICAPFLEFKDTDEEGEVRATLVPVAEEGLVFFYNEDRDRLLSRFRPWRENVLTVALEELMRNL